MIDFSKFLNAFAPTLQTVYPDPPLYTREHFRLLFSGILFGGGIYKLVEVNSIQKWNSIVGKRFPDYAGRIDCFGFDWLGRAFAVDMQTADESGKNILMFDPATSTTLRIPANFETFHNEEIVEYPDEALDSNLFANWLKTGRSPEYKECVSHKIPLMLGGKDIVENMEISDLEVNWELLTQIADQIKSN